jgi:hypothetical protein
MQPRHLKLHQHVVASFQPSSHAGHAVLAITTFLHNRPVTALHLPPLDTFATASQLTLSSGEWSTLRWFELLHADTGS